MKGDVGIPGGAVVDLDPPRDRVNAREFVAAATRRDDEDENDRKAGHASYRVQ